MHSHHHDACLPRFIIVETADEHEAVLDPLKTFPMTSGASRRLSLHASALSDDEYQFYTTSLQSIVSVEGNDGGASESQDMDDAYYENMKTSVREARAWLRGRYSHLSSLIIDKVREGGSLGYVSHLADPDPRF